MKSKFGINSNKVEFVSTILNSYKISIRSRKGVTRSSNEIVGLVLKTYIDLKVPVVKLLTDNKMSGDFKNIEYTIVPAGSIFMVNFPEAYLLFNSPLFNGYFNTHVESISMLENKRTKRFYKDIPQIYFRYSSTKSGKSLLDNQVHLARKNSLGYLEMNPQFKKKFGVFEKRSRFHKDNLSISEEKPYIWTLHHNKDKKLDVEHLYSF